MKHTYRKSQPLKQIFIITSLNFNEIIKNLEDRDMPTRLFIRNIYPLRKQPRLLLTESFWLKCKYSMNLWMGISKSDFSLCSFVLKLHLFINLYPNLYKCFFASIKDSLPDSISKRCHKLEPNYRPLFQGLTSVCSTGLTQVCQVDKMD